MPRKKCKECGKSFSTENNRVQYCKRHRRREKPLRKIEDIYQCPTCQEILDEYVAGLGRLLDEIKELPDKIAKGTQNSRVQYAQATRQVLSKPTRYDRHVERLGWHGVGMIADRSVPTMKSIIEMTGYRRTAVRRHLNQHLVPLGYLQRIGRSIEAGPKLGQGLPRYHLYYAPERTRWLPPVGYFGFTSEDYEGNQKEFKKLNDRLKLVSEELVVFWLRTRLRQLEEEIVELLSSEDLDIETKGVTLYGTRLVIEVVLKEVLSNYAPILSKSGRNLSTLRKEISRITGPTIHGKIPDLEEAQNVANELQEGKSHLLKKQWAQIRINDVVNFVQHRITFDMPTVIIDWKHEQSP